VGPIKGDEDKKERDTFTNAFFQGSMYIMYKKRKLFFQDSSPPSSTRGARKRCPFHKRKDNKHAKFINELQQKTLSKKINSEACLHTHAHTISKVK